MLRREVNAPAFEALWQRVKEECDEPYRYKELKDTAEWIAGIQREAFAEVGTYYYSGPRPGGAGGEEATEEATLVDLSDYELRCARTYSEYLGIWAGKRPEVLAFRAFTLGGTQPTGCETDEDMLSPARLTPIEYFDWW